MKYSFDHLKNIAVDSIVNNPLVSLGKKFDSQGENFDIVELAIDSLARMEMMIYFELHHHIIIEDSDLMVITSLNDLVSLLNMKFN